MQVVDLFRAILKSEGEVQGSPVAKEAGSSHVLNFKATPAYTPEGKSTIWTKVTLWGKLAEMLSGNVQHGDTFFITGDLQRESYETDSGETRYTEVLTVTKIVRVKSLPLAGESSEATEDSGTTRTKAVAKAASTSTPVVADDIPF